MIEARELTKRYGATTAVEGLSFTVERGMVTGFLGPNGAGKSTTMRLILGLDRPDAGSALVDGRRYRELRRPLRHVGALLEAGGLHPTRTAYHHLLWLAQTQGLGKDRVGEVLELTGLAAVARKRVGTFSLGMKQRLGLAAALLGDPPGLLLDEPMNGLDTGGMAWIRQLLRSLAAEGRAVLVSSHLMGEMAQVADRLVVIGRGRLVADTTVVEFVSRAGGTRVRVRTPEPARLVEALAGRGVHVQRNGHHGTLSVAGLDSVEVGDLAFRYRVPLHELTEEATSLESAFLQLTRDDVEYQGRPR